MIRVVLPQHLQTLARVGSGVGSSRMNVGTFGSSVTSLGVMNADWPACTTTGPAPTFS